MKRTLIQFDDETYVKLRQQAFEQGKSISALTRELVDKGLGARKRKKIAQVDDFSFVGSGKSKQGAQAPVSEKHDLALAEIRRK